MSVKRWDKADKWTSNHRDSVRSCESTESLNNFWKCLWTPHRWELTPSTFSCLRGEDERSLGLAAVARCHRGPIGGGPELYSRTQLKVHLGRSLMRPCTLKLLIEMQFGAARFDSARPRVPVENLRNWTAHPVYGSSQRERDIILFQMWTEQFSVCVW